MNKTLVFILLTYLMVSCVNLREPYPIIDYYKLPQKPTLLTSLPEIDKNIQLRRVVVNESFDTPHILISSEPADVKRLFYHRWLTDVSSMTTDFIATRINQIGILKNGIMRSNSAVIPDYIIEVQLIDMTAFNYEEARQRENYVQIELKVNFLKRMANNDLQVVFSRNYKQIYTRRKLEIKYIPDSYGVVFSLAVDNIISDLSNIIK